MAKEKNLKEDLMSRGVGGNFYYDRELFTNLREGQFLTPYKVVNLHLDENGEVIAARHIYDARGVVFKSSDALLSSLLEDVRATTDPFTPNKID